MNTIYRVFLFLYLAVKVHAILQSEQIIHVCFSAPMSRSTIGFRAGQENPNPIINPISNRIKSKNRHDERRLAGVVFFALIKEGKLLGTSESLLVECIR